MGALKELQSGANISEGKPNSIRSNSVNSDAAISIRNRVKLEEKEMKEDHEKDRENSTQIPV